MIDHEAEDLSLEEAKGGSAVNLQKREVKGLLVENKTG